MKNIKQYLLFNSILFAAMLMSYSAIATQTIECGTSGNLEERIQNCSTLTGSQKTTSQGILWSRVARKFDTENGRYKEVWKDSQGKVWSDVLGNIENGIHHMYTGFESIEMDELGTVLAESICTGKEAQSAIVGLTGVQLALPTREEFIKANQHGIREVIADLSSGYFWTATSLLVNHATSVMQKVYDGRDGYSNDINNRQNPDYVICVTR